MILDSPYKGLVPFEDTELDALLFFGRERESEIIAANVLAARLTVLYGPSGVGKSSVLRAGVAHRLRRQAGENVEKRGHPEFAVVVFDAWSEDPIGSLRAAVREELAAQFGSALLDEREGESLADTLGRWTTRWRATCCSCSTRRRSTSSTTRRRAGFARRAAGARHAGRSARACARWRSATTRSRSSTGSRGGSRTSSRTTCGSITSTGAPHAKRSRSPSSATTKLTGQSIEVEPALVEAVLDQTAAGKVDLGDAGRGLAAGESDEGRIEAALPSARPRAGLGGGARRWARATCAQRRSTDSAAPRRSCARTFTARSRSSPPRRRTSRQTSSASS